MRRLGLRRFWLLLVAVSLAVPAFAQYSADKPLGASAQSTPAFLKNAGLDQRLGTQIPLNLRFRDSTQADAPLGRYFGRKPVALALVYFKCAMLCPQVLHGLANSLAQTGYTPARDYDVVVASIDPSDTPADAATARQKFITELGGNVPADSVHFLTGAQPEITALANSVGFHYVRVPGPDGKMTQFAHSSVIMVATPEGKLSKYLTGVEYQPRDLRLALLEASDHRIGSPTDLILLYCCSYSPSEGRYTVSVLRVLGLAGMASLFGLAAMLYLLSRKPKVKTAA
ncbi:MAG TPA: SCO family protein [Acidobacteriaceae bacterium]